MHKFEWYCRSRRLFLLVALSLLATTQITAQQASHPESPIYEKLKKFELRGKASVSNLTLKRDRATMVFTGDFYFAAPIDGRVTGAVFIGAGTFHAEAPDSPFEKEYLKRFIDAEVVDSDFHTAVLRFSDDTPDIIGKGMDANAAAPNDAQKLAAELDARLLKETGANISERMLISLVNKESPGLFLAQFDKGRRNRFTYLVDPQARLLGSAFGINAGEKVLLFSYASTAYTNDLWIAAHSEADVKSKRIHYSDEFDLVSPDRYTMEIDVRQPRTMLKTKMRIDFKSLVDNLNAIPMNVNKGLSEYDNKRVEYAMRITSAKQDGKDIVFIQEDNETGLALVMPRAMKKGEIFSVELSLEGDFMSKQRTFENNYYPQFDKSWYPTHGYLKRSQYDLVFRHKKIDRVSSIGKLVREGEWPDSKDDRLTEFRIETPVPYATFAAGRFERYSEKFTAIGEMPIEVYSISGAVGTIKEKSLAAYLGDAISYFSKCFGAYPYSDFRGTINTGSGQSFPTLALIPSAKGADEANRATFSLVGQVVSRQWWGNSVAWRSYRDQWLSDGFAEYSGMMFVGARQNLKSEKDLIKDARFAMEEIASGDRGTLGKVAIIGPMIFGSRLNTRMTKSAGQRLVNTKGALVMRMLHFLFTDLSLKDQKDRPFYNMLTEFAKRFQGGSASTEDFMLVAGEQFAKTALAQRFGLTNLDWFFDQWIYDAKYPSYRLEYGIEDAGGQSTMTLNVIQENAGPEWFMPLPVSIKFADNTEAQIQVYAKGPQSPALKVPLPKKVSSVELDPDYWIFSEKTTTKKK
jgi:hypothetical protein